MEGLNAPRGIWISVSTDPNMDDETCHGEEGSPAYSHSTRLSAAKNWRDTEAPRNQVRALTGKPKSGKHFPAMPYPELPAYFHKLSAANRTVGRLSLMFLIATAARSTEVREARWCHIDVASAEWRRPASLMRKSNEAHVVTLNKVVPRDAPHPSRLLERLYIGGSSHSRMKSDPICCGGIVDLWPITVSPLLWPNLRDADICACGDA